ncbi:hypothetical protein KY310_01460 [Candidatus Woesearchaeota archaeon]|nr:hypothetical protein [Candidatus Woesearchaeota archaeon]
MDYEDHISELKWKIAEKIAFILMIISITTGLAVTKNRFIKKIIPETRALVQYSKENPQLSDIAKKISRDTLDLRSDVDRKQDYALLSAISKELSQANTEMFYEDYSKARMHLKNAEELWRDLHKRIGSTRETKGILNKIIQLKQELICLEVHARIFRQLNTIKKQFILADKAENLGRILDDLKKQLLKLPKADIDKALLQELNTMIAESK